jgi:hypothetical protein
MHTFPNLLIYFSVVIVSVAPWSGTRVITDIQKIDFQLNTGMWLMSLLLGSLLADISSRFPRSISLFIQHATIESKIVTLKDFSHNLDIETSATSVSYCLMHRPAELFLYVTS